MFEREYKLLKLRRTKIFEIIKRFIIDKEERSTYMEKRRKKFIVRNDMWFSCTEKQRNKLFDGKRRKK